MICRCVRVAIPTLAALAAHIVSINVIAADATPHYKSPITLAPAAGVRFTLEERRDQWWLRSADSNEQKLDDALGEDSGKAAVVLVADFNYDGYPDVAVLAGVGYMGAMTTYRLHLWDPAERRFKKFKPVLGNPSLEPLRKAVIVWERDGPQWTSTEYRARNGVLAAAIVREQNALRWLNLPLDQLTIHPPVSGKVSDSRIVSGDAPSNVAPETLPSATAQISEAKVWLHEQPMPSARTGMYLIKGDTVTLLDYRPSRDGDTTEYGWLLIRFEGKKKLEKWIPAGSVVN